MTHVQLAERLNVSDKAVSKWELGRSDPSLDLVKSLADVFGCSIDYLVNGRDKISFLDNDIEFFDRCFELLKKEVPEVDLNDFFKNFKFVKIEDGCMVFETTSKKIYDEVYDSTIHDKIPNKLIVIAMSIDKKVNGFQVVLVGDDENIKMSRTLSLSSSQLIVK